MQENDRLSQLEDFESSRAWLSSLGIHSPEAAFQSLQVIAATGIPLDLIDSLFGQLERWLPETSAADDALKNLERFIVGSRSPISLAALIQRDLQTLPILLEIFSSSQRLSDLLIQDPEGFDLIRLTEGQPISKVDLLKELKTELDSNNSFRTVVTSLRRFKNRELLRIAYGDWIRELPLETTVKQLTGLAEVISQVGLDYCLTTAEKKFGWPTRSNGKPVCFSLLAFGELAGECLGFEEPLEITGIFDHDGNTTGPRRIAAQEFFGRALADLLALLSDDNPEGIAYRLKFNREASAGRHTSCSQIAFTSHYDHHGQAWDRLQLIRCRPIAGDLNLGQRTLDSLQAWIFPRYITAVDLAEFHSLRPRLQAGSREESELVNIREAPGGIAEIEFTIQYLQLRAGNQIPTLRTPSFFESIRQLADHQLLNDQEKTILLRNYNILKKVVHRLQLQFDSPSADLPSTETDAKRLVMGLNPNPGKPPFLKHFMAELKSAVVENGRIINHLLHSNVDQPVQANAESDLILNPMLLPKEGHHLLQQYGFVDLSAAMKNLEALASEKHRFISNRRCRYFLAAIVKQLLSELANSGTPDKTLEAMVSISDSLGGKGLLWELFQANHSCLRLYIQICSTAPYLASILKNNPGMIDELMDSLMISSLPDIHTLQKELQSACSKTTDILPILHGFKNSKHLAIGIRDIVGQEKLEQTHQSLSHVAECCILQIAETERQILAAKIGIPTTESSPDAAPDPIKHSDEISGTFPECAFSILAFGKLGGREPNYHSPIGFLIIYQSEGFTRHPSKGKLATNQDFFNQLSASIAKTLSRQSPQGRLYELDSPLDDLTPNGKAFTPTSLENLLNSRRTTIRGFLNLTQCRPIGNSAAINLKLECLLSQLISNFCPDSSFETDLLNHRAQYQEKAGSFNLKRFPGGSMDIELLAQVGILTGSNAGQPQPTSTVNQLEFLRVNGMLNNEQSKLLSDSYRFLRVIESRLRLMDHVDRHSLPLEENTDPFKIEKENPLPECRTQGEIDRQIELTALQHQLARLMHYDQFQPLVEDIESCRHQIRELVLKWIDQQSSSWHH